MPARFRASRSRRFGRGAEGFTLFEVMVALSILAVTFVVVLGLQNRDILQNDEALKMTRGTLLAQQQMAALELEGFPPLGIVSGDFPEPDETFHWTQTVVSTPFDFAREVTIVVRWDEAKGGVGVNLVTYLVQGGP